MLEVRQNIALCRRKQMCVQFCHIFMVGLQKTLRMNLISIDIYTRPQGHEIQGWDGSACCYNKANLN